MNGLIAHSVPLISARLMLAIEQLILAHAWSLFFVLCLAASNADPGFLDDPKMVFKRFSVKKWSYVSNSLDNMRLRLARHSEHDNARILLRGISADIGKVQIKR